jgi:hypothetical protein
LDLPTYKLRLKTKSSKIFVSTVTKALGHGLEKLKCFTVANTH